MSLSWFRSLLHRTPLNNTRRSRGTARPSVRPRLETLESRLAPANITWDGGGTTNNWDDRFNWIGDTAPVTGDALVFPNTFGQNGADPTSVNNVNTFTDNRAFSAITFVGRDYVITGQPIQILGGTITQADLGNNALNVDINFSNMTVSSPAFLTLGGALSGGNITKTGSGRVILTHDNPNFTGLMTVNAGTLVVSNSGALGASGTGANGTVVNSGAGLNQAEVELNGSGINVGPEILTLHGVAARLVNGTGSGNNSWAGSITYPGDAAATGRGIRSVAGQLTLSGVISSSADESGPPLLVIEGAGTTVFAGNVSTAHTGVFRVSTGTLVLQKTSGAQAIVGPLEVINSGTVRWAASDQISNTVSVRAEQGTLNLNGFNETVGPLNLDQATITTGAGLLTLSANVTEGIPSGPDGNSTITGNLSLGNANRTFTVNSASASADDLTISAVIQGGSARTLTKEGTGRLVLSGANQYLGQTVVNAGALAVTNAQALGANDPNNPAFLADGTDVKGGASLELRGNITVAGEDLRIVGTGIAGGGVLRTPGGGNTTWAGSVNLLNSVGSVSVGVDGTSQLTLSGTLSGSSNLNVAKVGTGKLTFTNATSQVAENGTFTVQQGTVNVRGASTVLNSLTDVVVSGGAALELENRTATFNQQIVRLNGSGISNAGALRLINGTATVSSPIVLDSDAFIGVGNGATLTQTGIISGATTSSLRKASGGNLILDAANTYAGTTVAAQGTLTVRQPTALGTTASGTLIHPGGKLTIDRDIDVVGEALTLGISGSAGEPVFAVAGVASETIVWNGPVTLNNASTIRVDGPGVTLQLPGTITSAAGSTLTKKGTGSLALTGSTSNTALDGLVVVNEGTLRLAKSGGAQAIDGNLVIGDGVGTTGSAVLSLGNPDQIPNTRTLTVNRDGLFDLLGRNETITRLDLAGGTVNTGTGNLTVISQLNSLAATDTAFVNGNLNPSGGIIASAVADGSADLDLVINAVVGSFVNKSGPGTLVFNGNNTNGQRARDGKMFINGSEPASNVEANGVSATPTLGGTGTVGRVSLVNGIVAPGAATGQAGTLTATNGFVVVNPNVASSRAFEVDLNGGLVAGVNYDQLNVIGTVTLGTNLTQLVVNTPDSFTANGGDAFVIINNDGTSDLVTGQFTGLPENSELIINGQSFRLSYRGANGNDNDVVLIRNSGSMFPNRSVTAVVTEGGFATLTGTISEPDALDFFILDVNWGDGTPTETYVFAPGTSRQISIRHRYLDNPAGRMSGAFPITLSWRDQHGEGNSAVMSVTVVNANPTVHVGGDVTLRPGESLSRTGFITDAGVLDTHTAMVDYGDGTAAEELTVFEDGSFRLGHRYARRGTYFVTVRVTDSDGGVGWSTFMVTV